MNKSDVEAILFLSDTFRNHTADNLFKMYQNFLKSEFNRPEQNIYICLSRYIGYLLYTGQEVL